MTQPTVSIIVTSYNYGRFLGRTIDSALDQTYGHVEVVVVDDGSTDDSLEVIRGGYAGRVTPVFKDNGGQASAFNTGFRASHGEVVCFLDSDDLVLPTAAEQAVRRMRDPTVVKVHWPLWLIDACGARLGGTLPLRGFPREDLRQLELRAGPYYDWNHLPPTSGNAWSRAFLEQILPVPEAVYRTCADEYLVTLAPIYGRIETIGEPQGCYRCHGHNRGWQRPLADSKVSADLARLEYAFETLAAHLRRVGIESDLDAWRQRNWNYLWMQRLLAAREDLRQWVPEGEALILIDGGEWGTAGVAGRRVIPFLERRGEYWGPPADDPTAVAAFERLRNSGVAFVAIWWTAWWWLDRYHEFFAHLRRSASRVLQNDRLIVFDFREATRSLGTCVRASNSQACNRTKDEGQ
jgi:glycosyltransferase involved in cell wall biosynthesis